jgi:CRP-like cAMP-binding protein
MPKVNTDQVAVRYRRFNNFVRGELRARRLKHQDLADYLGIDRSTLTARLLGRIEWSLRDAFRTLEFLGSDFDEI